MVTYTPESWYLTEKYNEYQEGEHQNANAKLID